MSTRRPYWPEASAHLQGSGGQRHACRDEGGERPLWRRNGDDASVDGKVALAWKEEVEAGKKVRMALTGGKERSALEWTEGHGGTVRQAHLEEPDHDLHDFIGANLAARKVLIEEAV